MIIQQIRRREVHSTRMEGKVCFVTGAGSGIGKEIALTFCRQGAFVLASDINIRGVEEVAKEINKTHSNKQGVCLAAQVDVTNQEEVNANVEKCVKHFGTGRLDVMVCNAGIQHIESVIDISFENWKKITSVHLDGAFLCTQAALKQIRNQRQRNHQTEAAKQQDDPPTTILYIGSVHSKLASMYKAPYVAAKHGMLGLARAVAKEAAELNVRTNVICPGFVMTPLVAKQIPEQAEKFGISEEDVVKKIMLKDTVDNQFTSLQDIADLATVFATWPTNALTGQSILASHGWVLE